MIWRNLNVYRIQLCFYLLSVFSLISSLCDSVMQLSESFSRHAAAAVSGTRLSNHSGFYSVQFSSPRLTWCWVLKHFRTTTVISLIDAVVAGKEMSLGVAGMRTKMVRRWHWVVVRSTLELLWPGMLGRQVKTGMWQEPRQVLEGERSRWWE